MAEDFAQGVELAFGVAGMGVLEGLSNIVESLANGCGGLARLAAGLGGGGVEQGVEFGVEEEGGDRGDELGKEAAEDEEGEEGGAGRIDAGRVDAGLDVGEEPGDAVGRFEDDVGGPIAARRLELVATVVLRGEG